MEIHVKDLIEKIWNDGVKDAEIKAAGIIAEAESKAEIILANAKKEAAQITTKAKEEALRSEQASREAIKQAGRDLILNLQSKITDVFNTVVKQEVTSAMSDKILGEIITKLIGAWKGNIADIQVILSEKDYKDLEMHLRGKLAEQINKGLEIKPSASLGSGFLIAVKDGSAYHNFSAEGIAAVLSESLSPKISTLLNESLKGKMEA